MQSEKVYDEDHKGYLLFYTEEHPYIGGLNDNELVVELIDETEDSTSTYIFEKEATWEALSSVLQN